MQAFREAARKQGRPIDQLIREAMAHYRAEQLEQRTGLADLPILPWHRLLGDLPSRGDTWEDIFESRPGVIQAVDTKVLV